MSKQKTRASLCHSVFGNPLPELPMTELPTRIQIAGHLMFLKDRKNASNTDVVPQLAQTLIDLWNRASIPTESIKNVKTKIRQSMEEGSKVSQHGKLPEKSQSFIDSLHKLFDIAGCQCKDLLKCTCEKNMKIPAKEHDFLIDQRTARQMQISSVDTKVTRALMRKEAKEHRLHERHEEEKRRRIGSATAVVLSQSCSSSSSEESELQSDDYTIQEDIDKSGCSGLTQKT